MNLRAKALALKMEHKRATRREYMRRYAAKDPERFRAMRRGYETTAKEQRRKAAAKRRLRQVPEWRERERARAREYAKTPQKKALQRFLTAKYRALQVGADGVDYCTNEKIKARFAMFFGRCAYCGAEDAGHVDHLIPLARGGSAFPSNLVPACRPCNQRKSWRTAREFGFVPSLRAPQVFPR